MAKEVAKTQSQEMVTQSIWVKGQNDNEFKNSVGFFRDPFTGKEFDESTVNVERVPGHKYAHIYASDGKTVIPVSSKFWTRQEKDDYNNSRKNPGSGATKSGSSTKSAKNEELRKGLTALKNYLTEQKKIDDTITGLIDDLMPADPAVEKAQKQVDSMTPEQKAMFLKLLQNAQ